MHVPLAQVIIAAPVLAWLVMALSTVHSARMQSIQYPYGLEYGEGIVWQQALLIPGPRMYGDIITFHSSSTIIRLSIIWPRPGLGRDRAGYARCWTFDITALDHCDCIGNAHDSRTWRHLRVYNATCKARGCNNGRIIGVSAVCP